MTLWYEFIDLVLPFNFAHYIFMKNALLGILLVTPMFGLIGTMVVNNKMAFFSDAIGHSALTGIAIGVIFGVSNNLYAMIIFAIIFSIVIIKVKEYNTASTDTIIGIFSSIAIALGVVILSYRGGFVKYSKYLIGDLLSLTSSNIKMLFVVFIVVMTLWILIFNKLLITGLNTSLAKSKGINTRFYEYIFTIVVAVIVTVSIQWVGVLIINSLLVMPAACARNLALNVRQYSFYSVIIALISGIIGLIISYSLGSASGATIVLISAIFYILTLIIKKILKR